MEDNSASQLPSLDEVGVATPRLERKENFGETSI